MLCLLPLPVPCKDLTHLISLAPFDQGSCISPRLLVVNVGFADRQRTLQGDIVQQNMIYNFDVAMFDLLGCMKRKQ